ncbi:hypothetical protein MMC18_001759 [Xylographa bjoerkii]|nr:hypothetical protein [Xylographa bjoerkii]
MLTRLSLFCNRQPRKRVYSLTKAATEAEILTFNRRAGDRSMLTVSLRPATAFGERATICLGKIVAVAQKGKTRFQMGSGKNLGTALLEAYERPPPPAERMVDGEKL